jgi:hypothetical protein
VVTATQEKNKTTNKLQEETPCQKEKEDVASAALRRKGTVIHH